MSATSSLERLKALDSIPDLKTQLKEIRQLCTHSARAEMIARWLTGKLQSTAEALRSAEAWEAHLATLRILPPERISTVLGPSKLMQTAKSALDTGKPDEKLLSSLKRLLDFLLELGDAPPGAAVRAVLSLSAGEAAEFVGIWLQQCVILDNSQPELDGCMLSDRIDTALRVWDLRKRANDEHEAFSRHCLVPCAALLSSTQFRERGALTMKRRYGSEESQQGRRSLESCLARHIFLPGRATFMKARAANSSKKQRDVGSRRPSFLIESLLEPLSIVPSSSDNGIAAPFESLPRLLEIALRSAPASSPTQRPLEKPWIETLFSTFFDLNKTEDGQLIDAKALSGLLTVLAKRSFSLQSGVLTEIVMKHAGLETESADRVDWGLVAAVVEVDASVFKDSHMAQTLFDAVTNASIKLGEDGAEKMDDRAADAMHQLWSDHIVVPVLKAFSTYNDFSTVLNLCAQQLEHDLHGTFWSVWAHLDEPIQSMLEESLTDHQVFETSVKYCTGIMEFNQARDTREILRASADIVMLNALLGGIRRETTLDKLQPHLASTFETLMDLHDAHIGPGLIPALQERRCWSLMTNIFEIWFPTWAAKKTDASAVVAQISSLVPRAVLDRAVGLSSTAHPEEYGSVEDPSSAADARCFAACVCTHMLAYRGKVSEYALRTYIEVLHGLGREHDGLSFDAFVLYPTSLSLMDSTIRETLLQSYVKSATSGPSSQSAVHLDLLRAVGSIAAAHSQPQVLDDLVAACLPPLQSHHDHSEQTASTPAEVLAEVLAQVPSKLISRSLRERILNTICEAYIGSQKGFTQALRPCLPLMLRLMELPNPTARIALEPELIMKMAPELDRKPDDDAQSSDTEFFEALVLLIIQQCVKTKDQERSKRLLVGLSSEASSVMKAFSAKSEGMPGPSHLALVKAIFRGLEVDSIDAMKAHMPHRKPSTVKKLVKALAKVVESGLQSPDEDGLLSLELLGSISPVLIAASEFDIASLLAVLAEFLDTRLSTSKADTTAQVDAAQNRSVAITALVHCYQILGRFAPPTPNTQLVMFADELLQLPLEPHQHATVLATFERFLITLGSLRVELVQDLLSEHSRMPASRALLVQLTTAKIEKTDFDGHDAYPPTKPLHSLLTLLSSNKSFTTTRRSLATIIDALKTKPFTINQYNIELTLQTLHALAQRPGPGKMILYLDVCTAVSTLLLHHRARLQGRFHIVVKLLQTLLARLFQPLAGWTDAETAHHPPTTQHATALARVVKLFCEPPHLRNTTKSQLSLIDESRREQAHVGTFVQYFLHTFCTQILHGTLGEGMRDALRPGVWAVVEAMEMGGREGGRSLSAAMTGGERAVLRGVFEEWRRFGRWRGG